MINIRNIENLVFFQDNFEKNCIDDENTNINLVANLNISNVLFQANNYKTIPKLEIFGLGGCLRIMNIKNTYLYQIIIIDSNSFQKAVGIKIINNDPYFSEISGEHQVDFLISPNH